MRYLVRGRFRRAFHVLGAEEAMPRNFDDELGIQPDGCLSPTGPLGLAANETPERLDVWIFQRRNDGTQTACMAFQDTFPQGAAKWTTKGHPIHTGDVFRPGMAVGMALLVSIIDKDKQGERRSVSQWTEAIVLKA
jgi:hypothetical protein